MSDFAHPRVGVAAYICHQGKVLAYKRIGKHGTDTWSVMGGHLEYGEHWSDCAARESLEEVGVVTHSPQLFAVTNDMYPEAKKHYVTLHVALKTDSTTFTNAEPDKHTELGWCDWNEFPTPRMPSLQAVYNENKKPPYLS